MLSYALITNNTVTNVVVWDGSTPYTPPTGATLELLSLLPQGASIGWTFNGSTWSPPSIVPPTSGLTFQQFVSLFTVAEFNTIVQGCTTNPAILIGFLKFVSYSGNIDVNSAQENTALQGLVTLGMITSARKTAIQLGTVMNPQA